MERGADRSCPRHPRPRRRAPGWCARLQSAGPSVDEHALADALRPSAREAHEVNARRQAMALENRRVLTCRAHAVDQRRARATREVVERESNMIRARQAEAECRLVPEWIGHGFE